MFNFIEQQIENGISKIFELYFRFGLYLQDHYGLKVQKSQLTERKVTGYADQIADATFETLIMGLLPVLLTAVIGIPLGVLLATLDSSGKHYIYKEQSPLASVVCWILNLFVNLGRAIPAIIMIVLFMGLSRFVFGTAIGLKGMIIPLTIAAIPFGARVTETAIRGVDPGILEAARSMGATPFQMIYKFLLPEAKPSIISGLTLTYVALVGYSAIAGVIGGGGWGAFAITVGHGRGETLGLYLTTFLLTMLVIIGQKIGDRLAARADKRKI